MNNQDSGSFFSLLREAIGQSTVPSERIDYLSGLLTEDKYSSISSADADEIAKYLEEASVNLEKQILESRDIEMINNLTQLKEFTNDLLNDAERGALEFVLANTQNKPSTQSTTATKSGHWLLDKFAGLVDDEA